MTDPAKPKSGYEKWQETIDQSKTNKEWDSYDSEIKSAVKEFDQHLSRTKGYTPLDWQFIKAMVWTESGGPDSQAWGTRPMQIGNPGDPGLSALLSGKEGGELVMPPDLKKRLNASNASTPLLNIRAGIAYLLMRSASFAFANVMDPIDTKIYEYTVKSGDSLEKISPLLGTTVEVLKRLNPAAVSIIRPGQKLRYQKASIQKLITGWHAITAELAAKKYNTKDPKYAEKLKYCLSVMGK